MISIAFLEIQNKEYTVVICVDTQKQRSQQVHLLLIRIDIYKKELDSGVNNENTVDVAADDDYDDDDML